MRGAPPPSSCGAIRQRHGKLSLLSVPVPPPPQPAASLTLLMKLISNGKQLGFRCFMPLNELCDPTSGMVKVDVGVHTLVDHWECHSRWEMDHTCTRNGLDSSYMDSLELTSFLRNVCLGLNNIANKFQCSDSSLVTKDFTELIGRVAYHSFLQHDIQGLARAICEEFEDKAKVGQHWEVSNKAHNAPMLFMVAKHGLDFWPLPSEKSRGVFLLYVKLYKPPKEELCFARGFLLKVSQKPSEALRKLNKMAGFMTCEHIVEFTRGVLSHEPIHGVFHSNLQRCKYSFRSNSSFKSYEFAPTDVSCISWIMILWILAICLKNLCSFQKHGYLQPPLLEVVVGKFAELPQEILMEIFALLETPDLVRAGSVCCSWNSAYTSTCSFQRYKWPQTPCLIYSSESADDNVAFIYSLEEKRTYKLTLPEPPIHRRYLIGSSNGWLVTADERSEMHLVNPITSEQVSLPSVVSIEQVMPIFDDNGAICKYQFSRHTADSVVGPSSTYSLSTLRDDLFGKALLFFTSSAGSYIVVLIHNPVGQLSFARSGDENWTWLPPHSNFEDCMYKDGLLYTVTLLGQIITFDISGTVVTTKIIMDRNDSYGVERFYIAQDPLGDLLLVRRPEVFWIKEASTVHGHSHAIFQNINWRIAIYKVCLASRKLVRINSLDEHALFLGHSESLCLSAKDYPQVKPNHIYFTDDCMSVSIKCRLRRRLVIGIFNLETKIMDEIVSPQPWSKCMAPLLMIPNPRKMFSALVTKH